MLYAAVCRSSFMFYALDLSGCKYGRKLGFKQVAFLARQYAEDVFSHHRATRDAKLSQFAVAVPGHNFIIAINCIKRERQSVNDCLDEAPLGLNSRRAALNLDRQIC